MMRPRAKMDGLGVVYGVYRESVEYTCRHLIAAVGYGRTKALYWDKRGGSKTVLYASGAERVGDYVLATSRLSSGLAEFEPKKGREFDAIIRGEWLACRESRPERVKMLLNYIVACRPSLVIVDRVNDLILNEDDRGGAHRIVKRLKWAAKAYETCILAVLDGAREGVDKFAGQLGEVLFEEGDFFVQGVDKDRQVFEQNEGDIEF